VPSYDVPSYDVAAPYGREPETGMPYSQRYKVIAGVLQLVLPFGVGRFYTGHVGTGLAQLLLTPIGIGAIWAFIDGILMLVGRPVDKAGRPLRP
jgi:TM2 domain-containing membrane protein YozV